MTDVFISYKKQDAGRVVRLVEALRAEGLTVWWDHGIRAGSEWDRSIHQALHAAKVVLAIWSEASVSAPWVKEEATVGKNRGVLLPVKIDEVEPPLGFMMIQAADLVGWDGDTADERWIFLLENVAAIAGQEVKVQRDAPLKPKAAPKRSPVPLIAAALALPVAGAGALVGWSLLGSRGAPPASPGSPPPPVATAPPPVASPLPVITRAEQQLWDKATAEKTRLAFQSYLLAYPNGAYAQRARDVLLTCRTEIRETWKESPIASSSYSRGVGDSSTGLTEPQACAKAKGDAGRMVKDICETIAHNGGYRNPRWTVQDRDCDCSRPNPRVMVCIADLPYSCLWDMKVAEHVDICG